jgi:hypothetical protein
MINLYIFLTITAIELVVVVLKVRRIKEHIQLAKEIGIQTRFAKHINKTEQFLIRMYENYKGMLLILAILILFANAIMTALIHIIIVSYQHIIILNQ